MRRGGFGGTLPARPRAATSAPHIVSSVVAAQDPAYPAGDVVQDLPIDWVRYDDPEVKAFKLNAERNNGRAAMFGILGMISHAALGQDALFPIVSK
jgi:light-harvesting complex I chlorophyll a/b binding protein 1